MTFLLSGYRVLDLTDARGWFCGKLLADLGADVVKIEPPRGDPDRRLGPFVHESPGSEKSLHWMAYNAGKRGITLDLAPAKGRETFLKLAAKSDFVIESFPPGYMESLSLGYGDLEKVNPRLILTSITPFGRTGPYRDFKGADLVAMGMGGYLFITGDSDMPPVSIGFPQAYLNAAADAAAASLIASYERLASGRGQHVDVSAQAAMVSATRTVVCYWQLRHEILRREGNYISGIFGTKIRSNYRCKDGYVAFMLMGGIHVESARLLMEWIASEGKIDDPGLEKIDWPGFNIADLQFLRRVEGCYDRFFRSHTKEELFRGALDRGIQLLPVNTVADVLNEPQMRWRGFWKKVDHPELGQLLEYPGPLARFSESAIPAPSRAPHTGEHNREIYRDIGLSAGETDALREEGII